MPAIVVNFTRWKLIVLFLLSWQLNANSADSAGRLLHNFYMNKLRVLFALFTIWLLCFFFYLFLFYIRNNSWPRLQSQLGFKEWGDFTFTSAKINIKFNIMVQKDAYLQVKENGNETLILTSIYAA